MRRRRGSKERANEADCDTGVVFLTSKNLEKSGKRVCTTYCIMYVAAGGVCFDQRKRMMYLLVVHT